MEQQYEADKFLPFRALLERQGYRVYYDRKNRTALAQKRGEAELFVDYAKKTAFIGTKPVPFQVVIRRKRIYVESGYFLQAKVIYSLSPS